MNAEERGGRARQPGGRTGRQSSRGKDPTAPAGAFLADLVKKWMRENRAPQRLDPEGIFLKWKEVVGSDIADRTRVVDVRGGELVVEVDSAPLLDELSTYYQSEILESLNQREEFRGIHKIRFKPGAF